MPDRLAVERKTFKENLANWRQSHVGKFVLIKNTDVIGFYDSLEQAFSKGSSLFGMDDFFIQQILPADSVNISFVGRVAQTTARSLANRRQRRFTEKREQKVSRENPVMEFCLPPEILHGMGPIIETYVGITETQSELLQKAGLPIPDRVRCRLLIDTGATYSMVKHEIAEKAGLKLISSNYPIHGVGVDTTGKIYIGRIWFICKSRIDASMTHNIWVDTQIASGTLQASEVLDGLIGRDVLNNFDFRYNGKTGDFTLRFLKST